MPASAQTATLPRYEASLKPPSSRCCAASHFSPRWMPRCTAGVTSFAADFSGLFSSAPSDAATQQIRTAAITVERFIGMSQRHRNRTTWPYSVGRIWKSVLRCPPFFFRQTSKILFDLQLVLRCELLARRLEHLLAGVLRQQVPKALHRGPGFGGCVGFLRRILAGRARRAFRRRLVRGGVSRLAAGLRRLTAGRGPLARLRLALARLALAGLFASLLNQAVEIVDDLPLKLLRADARVGFGDATVSP